MPDSPARGRQIKSVEQPWVGSIIGALGAVLAVYLMLRGQRAEDRERIQGALIREVIEFARIVVGHLETCENIRTQVIKMPVAKLQQAVHMPSPIIYPAVADKIGLLKTPQNVVAFYTRSAELAVMAQAIAENPNLQTAYLEENNIRLIVEALLNICQFAVWIIDDPEMEKEQPRGFDELVAASILSDLKTAAKQASEKFHIEQLV